VGILPGEDVETPIWIEALGCGEPNGCTPTTAVVAQRAVVRFTRGQTEEVPLLLASVCVCVTCGSDERCAEGGISTRLSDSDGAVERWTGWASVAWLGIATSAKTTAKVVGCGPSGEAGDR
jgi:hypothetical protein